MITYVFSNGRLSRVHNKSVEAKDFFYGYFDFINQGNKVQLIEFKTSKKIRKSFLYYLDRVFNKLFSLPFNSHLITTRENFKILRSSEKIILVNEKVGFSCLYLIMLIRLTSRNNQIVLFSMGLYSKKLNFSYFSFIHNLFIKLLIYFLDDIIFLGFLEFKKATELNKKNKSKFHFVPFSIDQSFWINSGETNKDYLLFIGNDGNRDYELLKQIISQLSDLNFLVVTDNELFNNFSNPNLEKIRGSWGNNFISDNEIKSLYQNALLTILPLKNSYQPSGQSVALQSMSMGTPVIISNTEGFWDIKSFENNKNIKFVYKPLVKKWKSSIDDLLNNKDTYRKIASNGIDTVSSLYSSEIFFSKLKAILKL